jgi:rhodanese-related sulfurtransferase
MAIRKKTLLALIGLALAGLIVAGCAPAAPDTAVVTDVSPAQVVDRLPADYDDGLIVLDVRTPEEWSQDCHIEGATLIPLDQLEAQAPSLLPDKDAEIIVYCRSGNRSAQAASLLVDLGYTNVSDMGGINDWVALGYPVTCGG